MIDPEPAQRFSMKFVAIGIAVIAVLAVGIGVVLGMGSGGEKAPSTAQSRSAGLDVPPSATPVRTSTALPAATPTTVAPVVTGPNRADCAKITGTAYQSDDERGWFTANCGARTGTGAAPAAVTGPAVAPSGGQAPNGERLVIPAAGVNADVWKAVVSSSGAMPDPVGYFNTVYYDFSAIPGFGGTPSSGNVVLSGHVDCGKCYNGGSGIAVFWYIRDLKPGDKAQYYTADGRVQNYVVTAAASYPPSTDWSNIVASGTADMTLITCTGTFSGGEYTLRQVVSLKKA